MNFKSFSVVFCFFVSFFNYSQNFEKVDFLVDNYKANFSTIDELLLKINSDFFSESDKARAVFYWICKNISYDVEFAKKIESQNIQAFSYKNEN
jgi:hypothetical protein